MNDEIVEKTTRILTSFFLPRFLLVIGFCFLLLSIYVISKEYYLYLLTTVYSMLASFALSSVIYYTRRRVIKDLEKKDLTSHKKNAK